MRSGGKFWRNATFMRKRPCPDHATQRCQMPVPATDRPATFLAIAIDLSHSGRIAEATQVDALAARVAIEQETLDELKRALVKKLDALRAWTLRGVA